jgi:hypothetical protein
MEQKSYWLKLLSKREFDMFKSKYKFESTEAESIVGQAKSDDVLALKVTTDSGLKILGAKVLNESTTDFFAELMSKGVEAI